VKDAAIKPAAVGLERSFLGSYRGRHARRSQELCGACQTYESLRRRCWSL